MTSAIASLPTLIVSAGPSPDNLRACLLEAGCTIVAEVGPDATLAAQLAHHLPRLIVLSTARAAGQLASTVALACGAERRPLLVFTSDASESSIDAAITAGVAAYVIDGIEPARVRAVLGVALARFRQQQKLLDELYRARTKLAERKVIDRAKGILMARYKLGEDEAYQKMRSMAMNKKLKLADLAQRLLDVEELLDS
ncbi:ANTAR domain-containing response regulator [Massilia sp. GCM10020059]|uniref:ANTAR domain-containing protein n=1 Tax=Massilia agrisoli TaxID=2892444 RepID=A0ABS8IV41_9BURK|nr:ANTAR domain-containing protein [Massilia agrisoli]MCC6072023.1 ANTAR domain-containing protein [Massilia agrisoli]